MDVGQEVLSVFEAGLAALLLADVELAQRFRVGSGALDALWQLECLLDEQVVSLEPGWRQLRDRGWWSDAAPERIGMLSAIAARYKDRSLLARLAYDRAVYECASRWDIDLLDAETVVRKSVLADTI